MICTWLVEIYLNRLNALQEADDEYSKGLKTNNVFLGLFCLFGLF
jgi:hypothetical protein